jgi:DNA repair exonuclease SbcCD ATPase subunit
MNSTPPDFSANAVSLRLKRRERSLITPDTSDSFRLTADRQRLESDQAALHEREQNLRAYEEHLRAMQAEIDARRVPESSTSVSPFPAGELSLQSAWDKLIRARELLEAEQTHLREDRLTLQAERAEFKRQQATLAAREQAVAAREHALAQPQPEPVLEPIAGQHTIGAASRFTFSPFALARSVLRSGK